MVGKCLGLNGQPFLTSLNAYIEGSRIQKKWYLGKNETIINIIILTQIRGIRQIHKIYIKKPWRVTFQTAAFGAQFDDFAQILSNRSLVTK